MKARHLVTAFVLAASALVVTACAHHSKRGDWRGPSAPILCSSDAECRGGTCAIEPGATQGSCTGTPSDGDAGPGDPSQDPNGPPQGPQVQPGPNDIKI